MIPLTELKNNYLPNSPNQHIKRKQNKRKRLLKAFKNNPTLDLKHRIKNLNTEIKTYFYSEKRSKIRKNLIPGNSKSLWKAVSAAIDVGSVTLPHTMTLGNIKITEHERSDCFAKFFEDKVKNITESVQIVPQVFNGTRKIFADSQMFMGPDEVVKCIKSIKCKNSEGYDRIPQRVLLDGVMHLQAPLIKLFTLVYSQQNVPEQWKVAKILPVHKKGSKTKIENYRPVANLCSASKIFGKIDT